MDEEQTDGVGDRHNGTGVADVSRWDRRADGAEPAWSSVRAALEPVEPVVPPPGPAHAAAGGSHRPAPGLDDATPPEGTPGVEPPLWREAARHAWAPPTSPDWRAPGTADDTGSARAQTPPARAAASAPVAPPVDPPAVPAAPADAAVPAETAEVAEVGAADRRGSLAARVDPPPAPVDPLAARVDPPPAPVDPLGDPADPTEPGLPPHAPTGEPPAATWHDLPQRVPAEPDVPEVPEVEEIKRAAPPAEAPQLARIADQLRRDDVPPEEGRSEGFDVDAVLNAVRSVAGVRAAALRTNPRGAHTLRLDLSDDADPVQVSRVVARLLEERMGLSAAPQHIPQPRSSPEPASGPAAPPAAAAPEGPVEAVATPAPAWQSRSEPGAGPPIVIDQVQVRITGTDATVEVRLAAGPHYALGLASGPAVDSYLVRLAAVSAAKAVDELAREAGQAVVADQGPLRCFVEHTGVVPFGSTEVAVVVVLLVSGGSVEQLSGSAVVDGDSRYAAVRATLGAVNRRMDALLAS